MITTYMGASTDVLRDMGQGSIKIDEDDLEIMLTGELETVAREAVRVDNVDVARIVWGGLITRAVGELPTEFDENGVTRSLEAAKNVGRMIKQFEI